MGAGGIGALGQLCCWANLHHTRPCAKKCYRLPCDPCSWTHGAAPSALSLRTEAPYRDSQHDKARSAEPSTPTQCTWRCLPPATRAPNSLTFVQGRRQGPQTRSCTNARHQCANAPMRQCTPSRTAARRRPPLRCGGCSPGWPLAGLSCATAITPQLTWWTHALLETRAHQ
jgi:hypothetical protein